MSKVRWGVLSTAKIGLEKVIPAMQRGRFCEVAAIASRDQSRARAAAEKLGIPRAHGSYEELLADPEVDAIYNPLPNHLHVSWSIRALEAGKHVLCEKPIGLTSAEGEQLVAAGRQYPGLKLMEAFMYRHHPQWRRAIDLLRSGEIGELRTVQSFLSYYNVDPGNIRNQLDIGGGALMDIGCYPVSLSRWVFDGEPTQVIASVDRHPQFGTDRLTTALLQFAGGTASFSCSTELVPFQRVNLFGTTGRIEIEIPFNAPPDKPCRLWIQRDRAIEALECEPCDQYTVQGDLFAQAVLDDTPVPTPIEDAVANMRVIEALFVSAERGSWVEVTR